MNNEQKKTYDVPKVEIVTVFVNSTILTGSNDPIGGEDL